MQHRRHAADPTRSRRIRRALVLAAAVTGTLAPPAAAAPRLETIALPSAGFVDARQPLLNNHVRGLNAKVLLPDGYDPSQRYPLLLLLHGISDDYRTWADPRSGDIARVALGSDAIIVMPESGRGFSVNWLGRSGRAWGRYVLEEVIPQVEARYPILPGREHHAIAGISMGGYGALSLAAKAPGYFGAAASFSGIVDIRQMRTPVLFDAWIRAPYTAMVGPLGGGYERSLMLENLAENLRDTRVLIAVGNGAVVPQAKDPLVSMLFLSNAERLFDESAARMTRSLRARGVPVTLRHASGLHDWWYWRRDLRWALRDWGLLSGSTATPASWSYATSDLVGVMWDLRYAFAAQPRAAVRFRREGAALTGEGRGTVTLTTAQGCAVTAALPFSLTLPTGPC